MSNLSGNNDNNSNNTNDPSQPEYWESLGIKPIVVDTSDPDYINKVTDQVTERINQVIEDFKKDK